MDMRHLIVVVVLASACRSVSSDAPATVDTPGPAVELRLPSGLAQRVTLSPAAPAQGQNVSIRSVLRNNGSESIALTSRICGLDYSGTLKLSQPPEVGRCAGFSMGHPIAPGDSVVGADYMRVDSPPGEYTLRVCHALTPEAWFELKVRVSPVAGQ